MRRRQCRGPHHRLCCTAGCTAAVTSGADVITVAEPCTCSRAKRACRAPRCGLSGGVGRWEVGEGGGRWGRGASAAMRGSATARCVCAVCYGPTDNSPPHCHPPPPYTHMQLAARCPVQTPTPLCVVLTHARMPTAAAPCARVYQCWLRACARLPPPDHQDRRPQQHLPPQCPWGRPQVLALLHHHPHRCRRHHHLVQPQQPRAHRL